jgi:hypothetical protein
VIGATEFFLVADIGVVHRLTDYKAVLKKKKLTLTLKTKPTVTN